MRFLGARRAVLLVAALGCSPLSSTAEITTANRGATARAVPLVTGPIDEGNRVVLAGNTRGEALRPDFDRGRLDDSYPLNGIQIQLKRSPEHEQAAEALADSLQRAGDPQFHQWLTAEQYAEQFGVANEDIAKINAWLTSHGFTVHDPSPSRMTIDFSGTAGQVREAFGTEMHALQVKGVQHIANLTDPQIPAALAPVIEGIVSLHDFHPRPMLSVHKSQYSFSVSGFQFFDMVPADLATIYNFNPLFAVGLTGAGQTIAVIEDSDIYDAHDWKKFRSTFGLDVYPGGTGSLKTVHPGNCGDPGLNANGDDSEAILDAEWASAAAPSADVQLAACATTSTSFGGLIAIQNILNQRNVPSILSFSYGGCESGLGATGNAAYKAAYLQATLEGVSVFVAAGDNGAAMCDNGDTGPVLGGVAVNGLASTAYDVAVGGTDFEDTFAGTNANYWATKNGPTFGSALSYVPEIPWNDACASTLISSFLGYSTPYGVDGFCGSALGISEFLIPTAGSGGPSGCAKGTSNDGLVDGSCKGWAKPSWQNVVGNPQDGVRDLPDVSLFAADGVWFHDYVFCNSDPVTGTPCTGKPKNWAEGGGTSFAAPIMAGMQALVNQLWGPQGNPAPSYYALASAEYGKHGKKSCNSSVAGGPAADCTFYDITMGDNDLDCSGSNNCFDPGEDDGVAGVLSLSDSTYQPTFTSGVGWDFSTGIGSVNAANLVFSPIWFEGCDF